MATTISLDERHFKAAANKARELGKTPEGYIEFLIDAATNSFDDILAPVRDAFHESGVSEEELDDAVNEARRAIAKQSQLDSNK